jgi:hypothetical protein
MGPVAPIRGDSDALRFASRPRLAASGPKMIDGTTSHAV